MLAPTTGKPIAFKCTEEFRQQTEAIADSLGKSLSDYVREAVEIQNKQMQVNFGRPEVKEIVKQGNTNKQEFKSFFKK